MKWEQVKRFEIRKSQGMPEVMNSGTFGGAEESQPPPPSEWGKPMGTQETEESDGEGEQVRIEISQPKT